MPSSALWIFIVHSLTAARPFLDPRLLLDRNFSIGLMVSFVMGMLSFTPMVLFPILLHDLRGYPDSLVGMLLAARGIGNWLSFLIVVPFTRWNPRLAVGCGLALQAVSGFAMAQLDINVSSFDVFWMNVLQGFGFGLAFTPMTVLAFATLPPDRMTEGTGIFHLVRSFGSSLFISATVVLLLRSTSTNYSVLHRVPDALQQGIVLSRGARALEHVHAGRLDGDLGRDAAPGGNDRLHQRLLLLRVHRRRGRSPGLAPARCSARSVGAAEAR